MTGVANSTPKSRSDEINLVDLFFIVLMALNLLVALEPKRGNGCMTNSEEFVYFFRCLDNEIMSTSCNHICTYA
ncbi:hypothetical protein BB560_003886 [Smittium megazygosporum]|uniref:Uncharacterized protein n=1 Tax=Smittium megazygosporum TaxID=133381 RepID=A0A2T9ZAR0_9FUNG|nr:hypothetical protein BB560_003886 [Smittium megazygosporum]